MNWDAFTAVSGSFGMLGKAFPDEVAVEGGGLVLIAYIQPTALLQAWQGRGSRSKPGCGDGYITAPHRQHTSALF